MAVDSVTANKFEALRGRHVFVTGHTGFKGAWLTTMLHRLGCTVSGFSLPPEADNALFSRLGLADSMAGCTFGDIRDAASLRHALTVAAPEIVLHLAAQSLVRRSYSDAQGTWATNVMGTVNLLEAVRQCPSVKAVLVVTTDKCYDNKEWSWGYREVDALGGHDPYSASKAGAELVAQSYRKSFFESSGVLLATARAGNVIGGGDWSEDRLLPDAARAVLADRPLVIRNPDATRPWQHVLDCLSGYLLLASALVRGNRQAACAFNFGPATDGNLPVGEMLTKLQPHWPGLTLQLAANNSGNPAPHEAGALYLDSSRARLVLGWNPHWSLATALEKTAAWYREVAINPAQATTLTEQQIEEYLSTL